MATGNDDYDSRLLAIHHRKLAYLERRLSRDLPRPEAEALMRERWFAQRAIGELSEHPRGPARARWRRQRPDVRGTPAAVRPHGGAGTIDR